MGSPTSPHLQLGEFLRVCRHRLRPADVGLTSVGRRRTPGLRREEVATLAGVSIDYLVRIEQGRDHNPSPPVLRALATALQLDPDEQETLWRLAAMSSPDAMCPIERAAAELPATVVQLVDRLDPTPAFVSGAATEVLASNRAWRTLADDLGFAGDDRKAILVRSLFLDPRAREVFPDWDVVADDLVASMHRGHLRGGPAAVLEAVVAELLAVPEFAVRWTMEAATSRPQRILRVIHPTVGELRLSAQELLLSRAGHRSVVTWLPADERSERALLRATTRSDGRLRVVGAD